MGLWRKTFVREQHVPVALWRTATRLDRSKINTWIALRNTLGIVLPLAVGIALQVPLGGVAVATGALNVCFSDSYDPYPQRARRMLTWSALGGFAVFTGAATGEQNVVAVLVAAAWAMVAGMAMALGSRAGDLGLNTLVTVIVFAARPMPVESAFYSALLVFAGGVLQMLLALLLWPIRRRQPEREAIGEAYRQLAAAIHPDASSEAATLLYTPVAAAQDVLEALGRDHSIEGERYRLLLDQASRIRTSAFVLRRALENGETHHDTAVNDAVSQLLRLAARLLDCVGNGMTTNQTMADISPVLDQTNSLMKSVRQSGMTENLRAAMESLAGQLRVVAHLAESTTPEGSQELSRREMLRPWKLQLSSWIETLRANLSLNSVYFRHAIRMAVCVVIGDAVGRSVDWMRTYWIPMTIAVILKPDFASTFSRGLLRLLGTFSGLVLATILYHVMPPSPWTEPLLVGAFAWFLRWIGPANYGVFSAAVAGLVVFLIAATGVSPQETAVARGVNTAAGGVLALVAYAVWPTWERTQVRQVIADMLDRSRHYIHEVARRLAGASDLSEFALEESRRLWRLARSNAEASVDRFSAEPGARPEQVQLLTSILASSHSVVYSAMVLEAEWLLNPSKTIGHTARAYFFDVEFTLYYLAAALRGAPSALIGIPDLRKSRQQFVDAQQESSPSAALLLSEVDRLTVGLNTLREQIEQLVRQ